MSAIGSLTQSEGLKRNKILIGYSSLSPTETLSRSEYQNFESVFFCELQSGLINRKESNINVREFPYDWQICTILFNSLIYSSDEVNISNSAPVSTLNLTNNVEWRLEQAGFTKHETTGFGTTQYLERLKASKIYLSFLVLFVPSHSQFCESNRQTYT